MWVTDVDDISTSMNNAYACTGSHGFSRDVVVQMRDNRVSAKAVEK